MSRIFITMPSHESQETIDSLKDLCEVHGVTCLIQVGAEDGYESACISSAIGCVAIAIEGDSRHKPLDPDLEFHTVLIGATNCTMPFYINRQDGLSTQIKRDDNKETTHNLRQYRLDTFCAIHDIEPDALIIDTEGTTLDVLEGCGGLLDDIRVIYAECQTTEMRPGIRMVGEVDKFLTARGFSQHSDPPSYWNDETQAQGNYTWVRK